MIQVQDWENVITEHLVKNYYKSLLRLDSKEIEEKQKVDHSQVDYLGAGASIGRRFKNTEELKPMKYKKAIIGPDGEAWKEETTNKCKRMIDNDFLKLCKRKICHHKQSCFVF